MKDYILRHIKKKQGKTYIHEYTNKRGHKLNKKEYEPLIKNLYIAPAYDNVKINKHKKDKVLAIGTDDRGRKQYTYNPNYIQSATDNKYRKLIEFGNNYQCIMKRIHKDIWDIYDWQGSKHRAEQNDVGADICLDFQKKLLRFLEIKIR